MAHEESRQPPPGFKPDARYAHMLPMSAEEWDWTLDSAENGAGVRSKKRLEYAACCADPRAIDQMAQVLRMDLLRVLGDHTHKNAYFHHTRPYVAAMKEQIASLTQALANLANAADGVGVRFFDTDTMEPEVFEMQQATQAARAVIADQKP